MNSLVPLQLFATDLNSTCVAKARTGVYPASIEQQISPERLKRFFCKEEAGYRISKDIMGGLQTLAANMLAPPDGKVTDIASLLQTLKGWVEANKDVVTGAKLILGFGYDQSQLKELRAPTKEELDTVSIEIPVVVVHQSGHMGAFNLKALEIAGYSAESQVPPGGVIQRKPGSREPSGVLEETAWMGAIPKVLGNIGPAGMRALAAAGSEMWASYGYTTAQEGRSNKVVDDVFRAVSSEGKFKIEIVSYPDVLISRDYIKDHVSPDYLNGFRVGGAKLTIDGSPQGFTHGATGRTTPPSVTSPRATSDIPQPTVSRPSAHRLGLREQHPDFGALLG
jgi:predicted amidohydrolase YtcJ